MIPLIQGGIAQVSQTQRRNPIQRKTMHNDATENQNNFLDERINKLASNERDPTKENFTLNESNLIMSKTPRILQTPINNQQYHR